MAAQEEPVERADTAMQQRLQARLDGAPRVVALQGGASLAGRIARYAQGRLPLLDALQRRWGASTAWPGRSELPLVTPLADASSDMMGQETTAASEVLSAEAGAPARTALGATGQPAGGPQSGNADRALARGPGTAQPAPAAGVETIGTPEGTLQSRRVDTPALPTVAPYVAGARPTVERPAGADRADLPLSPADGGLQAHDALPGQASLAPTPQSTASVTTESPVLAASSSPLPIISAHPVAGAADDARGTKPPAQIESMPPRGTPQTATGEVRGPGRAEDGPRAQPFSTAHALSALPLALPPATPAAVPTVPGAIRRQPDAAGAAPADHQPVTAQAATVVPGTPADSPTAAARSMPVVRPASTPAAYPVVQSRPMSGSTAGPAPATAAVSSAVWDRGAGPGRATDAPRAARMIQRRMAGEAVGIALSAGEADIENAQKISGAVDLPSVPAQPGRAEGAQGTIRQVAATSPRLMRAGVQTGSGAVSEQSISHAMTAVAPPAPGVVRVWGAPIVQRSRGRAADAQAATQTERSSTEASAEAAGAPPSNRISPLEGQAVPSAGPISAARTFGAPPAIADGLPPGTLARTTVKETRSPEAPSVGGPDAPAARDAQPISGSGAAATGIARKDPPQGQVQTTIAYAAPSAPPTGELRLARQVSDPRVAAPSFEITPAASAAVVAPLPAALAAWPVTAPTLQLADQVGAAPEAAPTATSGASVVPQQEAAAPPPQRRLDETEMARVVDAVLATLKQRLQLERESRGL